MTPAVLTEQVSHFLLGALLPAKKFLFKNFFAGRCAAPKRKCSLLLNEIKLETLF